MTTTEKVTQVTQVNTGVGNSSSTPVVLKRSRKFCFTVNNYDFDYFCTITQSFYEDFLHKRIVCYIIGEEVGENGTPHLQGFVQWKDAKSFKSVNKEIPKAHIEAAKGSLESNFKYCSKDGKYVQSGMDKYVKEYIRDPLEGKVLYEYQRLILDLIKEEPNERVINWYWEINGNVGKSSLCKHICLKYKCLILNGKQNDMFNAILTFKTTTKKWPKIIILDIPRTSKDYVSYAAIENIKNGCFYSGKYEGGQCVFNSPHVIVFANSEPVYESMSGDRWNVNNIDKEVKKE